MRTLRGGLRLLWNSVRPLPRFTIQQYAGKIVASPFPLIAEPDDLLAELARKHRPSKIVHDYLKYYHLHFQAIRSRVRTVLEVSVDAGNSLAMWEEYFPNAVVHGIDVVPGCKRFEGGRRRVHIGDTTDPAFLDGVLAVQPDFDIVIDDGSHRMADQLWLFDHLFPRLTSHGIYVLEDTGACVGDRRSRVIRRMAELVRQINYWPATMPDGWPPDTTATPAQNWATQFPTENHWADRNIVGISFYRWIVFVQRGPNPENNPFFIGQA